VLFNELLHIEYQSENEVLTPRARKITGDVGPSVDVSERGSLQCQLKTVKSAAPFLPGVFANRLLIGLTRFAFQTKTALAGQQCHPANAVQNQRFLFSAWATAASGLLP
jgi:hypothetical protein